MKDIESQAVEYAEALSDIAEVLGMNTGATSAEIVNKARKRFADGIYKCHDDCARERCIDRHKIKVLRKALEDADECLALIQDKGNGLHSGYIVSVRGVIERSMMYSNMDPLRKSPETQI
jgi:Mg2+/Co2+ transporter CorC